MQIAIVGGAGFIGTNLYFYLKNKKIDVKVFDNFLIKDNLKFISKRDLIRCDILNRKDLFKKIKHFKVVINLAGQTGVVPSNQYPIISIKKNILGFLNLLEACKFNNIKTLINASTGGAIYGDSKKISNENDTTSPLSIYGLTKDFNEKMSKILSGNIKVIHLRFSNVYGPYSLHKKSLIHNSIKSKITNKNLIINGNGYSQRDFIYVNDLCKIIYKLKNLNSGIYNIASGKSYSIKNIIDYFKKLDFCPNIKFKKSNKGEVKIVRLSNNKIKKKLKLNVKFFTKIYFGLEKTVIWYKQYL